MTEIKGCIPSPELLFLYIWNLMGETTVEKVRCDVLSQFGRLTLRQFQAYIVVNYLKTDWLFKILFIW